MDHAAAHELLADLALEPRRLRGLEGDASRDAVALRGHLAECRGCRAELEAWHRVYAGLDVATAEAGAPLRSLEPSVPASPSAALRARTVEAIAREAAAERATATARASADAAAATRVTGTGGRGGSAKRLSLLSGRLADRGAGLGWLAAAAALVLALGLGGLLVQRAGETDQAQRETAELGLTAATLDHILATPTHWVVTLRTADGAAGGTLAWSPSDVVVLTSALPAPTAGTTYRCWIERDGTRTPVGTMSFSGSVGYWAGSATSWGALGKGSRFGVTAVSGGAPGGPAVLVADL